MKASELVETLQAAIEEHGDLEVCLGVGGLDPDIIDILPSDVAINRYDSSRGPFLAIRGIESRNHNHHNYYCEDGIEEFGA